MSARNEIKYCCERLCLTITYLDYKLGQWHLTTVDYDGEEVHCNSPTYEGIVQELDRLY